MRYAHAHCLPGNFDSSSVDILLSILLMMIQVCTMTKCIVAGCTSSNVNGDKVHNVPSARKIAERKKWLSNFNRQDLLNKSQKIVVCNKHFLRKCYQKNLRLEYLERKIQYDLIPGSVPTIVQRGRVSLHVYFKAYKKYVCFL